MSVLNIYNFCTSIMFGDINGKYFVSFFADMPTNVWPSKHEELVLGGDFHVLI